MEVLLWLLFADKHFTGDGDFPLYLIDGSANLNSLKKLNNHKLHVLSFARMSTPPVELELEIIFYKYIVYKKENLMGKIVDKISSELVDSLQGEKIVSLVTNDVETNQPDLSVISWLVAHKDGKTVKFAVGHKANAAKNIQGNPQVILGVTGAGSCFSIKGKASVSDIFEKTMKLRIVTIDVESVEDVIFYGGKITKETEYEKTYDPKLAEKLDTEVYGLLKE